MIEGCSPLWVPRRRRSGPPHTVPGQSSPLMLSISVSGPLAQIRPFPWSGPRARSGPSRGIRPPGAERPRGSGPFRWSGPWCRAVPGADPSHADVTEPLSVGRDWVLAALGEPVGPAGWASLSRDPAWDAYACSACSGAHRRESAALFCSQHLTGVRSSSGGRCLSSWAGAQPPGPCCHVWATSARMRD